MAAAETFLLCPERAMRIDIMGAMSHQARKYLLCVFGPYFS